MATATRILFATAIVVAGCSTPPPRPTFPDIRFTSDPPIELQVGHIEVKLAYQAPFKAPNVDQLFPVQPEHAMENWAHDRLKAVGTSGSAVFTITNAAVTETDLKTEQGLTGTFTTQPNERYDMTLAATLTMSTGTGELTANAQTGHSQSLLQGITPNDRDRAWYDMTVAAMGDFNKQMASEIHANFGNLAQ